MSINKVYNPFRYGNPVPPDRFIGREDTLRVLFGRLHHGESAVVVGGPHLGKSSLLRYMAYETVLSQWLNMESRQVIPIEQDCHLLPADHQPADFWREVLAIVAERPLGRKIKNQLQRVQESNYGSYTLERFFKLLGESGRQIMLLIDEFEVLLNHSQFNSPEFFGALRTLAIKTDGLALIAASRLPIAELNRRTTQIIGSPFFNFCIDVPLPPLSPVEVNQLLEQALSQGNIAFGDDDCHYIERMSGRHPFLVQVSAAALFEATGQGATGNHRYAVASNLIQMWAGAHFDERWHYLNERSQQVLQQIARAEMHTNDKPLAETKLIDLDAYNYELRHLDRDHLIEHAPDAAGLLWQNQYWRISAASFAIWIAHNICELPQVRLEAATSESDDERGHMSPVHIIVYGDYVSGAKTSGGITTGNISGTGIAIGQEAQASASSDAGADMQYDQE